LKTYEWGKDPSVLKPIDEENVARHGNAEARLELENRLADVLKSDAPQAAKDYVCRKLMVIGTAASVSALAALLTDEKLSHMARYALERMPAPAAAQAMRDALPQVGGALKIGVIASLGVRQDAASVAALADLLGDADAKIAAAAATALGDIQTAEAATALTAAKPSDAGAKLAVTDGLLNCAEAYLAAGKKADALAIYKLLAGQDQPKHVKLAATRGMLTSAGSGQ
jgi:hypothetical protein